MFKLLLTLILLLCANELIFASQGSQPAKRQNFLQTGAVDQCEGKDAANYTLLLQFTEDQACEEPDIDIQDTVSLTACSPTGQKVVNSLKILARSDYPAGAYYQQEVLYLAISGNLEGKYVYIKEIGLVVAYQKKCSSILGYSYTSTKSLVVLIAEKLDLNVLLSPNGGYEPFKRSAQTVCNGRAYTV